MRSTPLQATPPDMSVCEGALWQALIQQRCGLYFSESRLRFLRQSLWERMRLHHTHSYGDYYHYVAFHPAGDSEWQALLELLLNHETSFFRHIPSFEALATHVLPALLHDPQRENELTMWSAGCATGQEAYSLAMAFLGRTPPPGCPVKIIGSDISQHVLDKARSGQYKVHELRQLPEYYRQRYFTVVHEKPHLVYQVSERVRTLVEFRYVNLCDPESFAMLPLPETHGKGGSIDVIFCQNVLIYFARESRVEIVQRLCQHLRLGGYLLLGPAEVVGLHLPGVRSVRLADALIYQRMPPD
jgi:chemotaxis methyl-accepting protein methylase